MDVQTIQKLEKHLCNIAGEYADRGIKSPDDVVTVKHTVSAIFKLKCLEEMENYRGGFSSRRGSYDGSSEGSYRRDSMGRYADGSFGSYSGHGEMRQKLEKLMQEAGNDRERQMIKDLMSRM